jgi:hypothetical protein
MINNQKNTQASRTRLPKHLLVGATSVVAAGALFGVGVAGASAATVQPTPVATHSSASVHSHHRAGSLIEKLRQDLFQGQISGTRAQALATRILENPAVAAALPANLTSDLAALTGASSEDAVAQAQHIKSTALNGGYGVQLQKVANDLQASATGPVTGKLLSEIRADLLTSAPAGSTGAGASAGTSSSDSSTSSSPTADEDSQQIQQLAQNLLSALGSK